MPLPSMQCAKCGQTFELLPNKPGKANVCSACLAPTADDLDMAKQKADLPKVWARSANRATKSWSMETHKKTSARNRDRARLVQFLKQQGRTDAEIKEIVTF